LGFDFKVPCYVEGLLIYPQHSIKVTLTLENYRGNNDTRKTGWSSPSTVTGKQFFTLEVMDE